MSLREISRIRDRALCPPARPTAIRCSFYTRIALIVDPCTGLAQGRLILRLGLTGVPPTFRCRPSPGGSPPPGSPMIKSRMRSKFRKKTMFKNTSKIRTQYAARLCAPCPDLSPNPDPDLFCLASPPVTLRTRPKWSGRATHVLAPPSAPHSPGHLPTAGSLPRLAPKRGKKVARVGTPPCAGSAPQVAYPGSLAVHRSEKLGPLHVEKCRDSWILAARIAPKTHWWRFSCERLCSDGGTIKCYLPKDCDVACRF